MASASPLCNSANPSGGVHGDKGILLAMVSSEQLRSKYSTKKYQAILPKWLEQLVVSKLQAGRSLKELKTRNRIKTLRQSL